MADDAQPQADEMAQSDAYVDAFKNKNTHKKTSSDLYILKRWMVVHNELRELADIPIQELDKILARFFMTVKKDDGSPYEPSTVRSFQSSISRYLMEKCKINIMMDKEFNHSRDVTTAKLKDLKSMGMGSKKRRAEPFTAEKVNLLYEKEFLGAGNPKSLLRTVWMNNSLHFGLRSRDEHTTLKWGDVKMKTTSDGIQYLKHTERSTKNGNGAIRDIRAFQAKSFADKGT